MLVQIKAANLQYKLKNEIRQEPYLLYQHNKITTKVYNNLNKSLWIMIENMFVIRDPKNFCFNFDWPKYVNKNLKHEIEFTIKSNEPSAETMERIFLNTENIKSNAPHRSVLNLSKRLDLRRLDKHVALQNLSIYYTWRNIRKQYKNNKLNNKQLPNGSYSV